MFCDTQGGAHIQAGTMRTRPSGAESYTDNSGVDLSHNVSSSFCGASSRSGTGQKEAHGGGGGVSEEEVEDSGGEERHEVSSSHSGASSRSCAGHDKVHSGGGGAAEEEAEDSGGEERQENDLPTTITILPKAHNQNGDQYVLRTMETIRQINTKVTVMSSNASVGLSFKDEEEANIQSSREKFT